MSADVPRRLPPTQGERVRNIDRSHASLSARGRTASARPVPQQPASAQIYRPPSSGNVVTGSGDTTAVSITSTVAGAGSSGAPGATAVAVGPNAYAGGDESTAVGNNADAAHIYSTALGAETIAQGNGSVAIGCDSAGTGAATHDQDVIKLGTSLHTTVVIGGIVIADDSNNLWRLTVSGGALSVVAYP